VIIFLSVCFRSVGLQTPRTLEEPKKLFLLIGFLFLLFGSSILKSEQNRLLSHNIKTFKIPNSIETIPCCINNSDKIAGFYSVKDDIKSYGFIYSKGNIETIKYSDYSTWIVDLNDHGHVIGHYLNHQEKLVGRLVCV
jgi:hypothetical protein